MSRGNSISLKRFYACPGRFLGIHRDKKVQKTLVLEAFFINNYAANSASIYKTEVKIQLIINGLVIHLSEACKKAHLFQIMSISFYINVCTSISSETSHFLFITWQCVNRTEFPFRLSFLRIHNSFRIHPYGLKISGGFLPYFLRKRLWEITSKQAKTTSITACKN